MKVSRATRIMTALHGVQRRVNPVGEAVAVFREIRFGQFLREISINQQSISYNDVTPGASYDRDGRLIPYRPEKIRPRATDLRRLLSPYIGTKLAEQLKALLPLALYLTLFQIVVLRQMIDGPWNIAFGLAAVVLGLMCFMEGLKLGFMPFAETIGSYLPQRSRLSVVLAITFLLGIGVTVAEPAIGALQLVGSVVEVRKAPYLRALLDNYTGLLLVVIGIGVGLAAVLGTLRFIHGWSLKPLIYLALTPTLGLTIYCASDPDLTNILALAWDCGAVTTGPVTVPLVLALGVGIAASAGKSESSLSGFGIITLASIFPILGVMGLAVYIAETTTPEAVIAQFEVQYSTPGHAAWYRTTPYAEILNGLRAIVPLILFLFAVLRLIVRERLTEPGIQSYGLFLSVLGMIVFGIGLSYGLTDLGGQSGSLIAAAFAPLDYVPGSPLYIYAVGVTIALVFAWVLGFGATLAEPALNALGLTVENLTNGAFRKSMLVYAVSFGVGCGIAVGVLKLLYHIPIAYILIPAYLAALVLTWLSSEEFVNVAWDSAGVTTGPVTVPLVLAMGLGFGGAVEATEGFGILAMASIGPILSVLSIGLAIQWMVRRAERAADEDLELETVEVA